METPETERMGRELQRAEWGVILSLIVSSATAIFAGGIVYGQVQAQEVRVTKLEAKVDQQADALAAQAVTVARIDANVGFLVEAARARDSKGR